MAKNKLFVTRSMKTLARFSLHINLNYIKPLPFIDQLQLEPSAERMNSSCCEQGPTVAVGSANGWNSKIKKGRESNAQ